MRASFVLSFLLLLLPASLLTQEVDEKFVHDIVVNITRLEQQALNWTYPTNSYSYLTKPLNKVKHIDDGTFDFIIVGAGSAGAVVANRLSEVKNWRVLLLEAGGLENNITAIPDLTDYLRATEYNWGYFTSNQSPNLGGYINNALVFPRGKGLGGTSIINAMIYARGNKADFDEWGKKCPGWSYDDILPYFKKSEIVSFPKYDPGYHGLNGTLHVEWSRIYDELGEAWLKANQELNRSVVYDYNGAPQDQLSFSIVQLTEVLGQRDSTARAFIYPALDRPNLVISTQTLVTKIIIEDSVVVGVQYVRDGDFHYARAKKEVIMSAGAVNTPQLLMLSGIGPREHLEALGIEVLRDLPVGDNLWDHTIYNYQSFAISKDYTAPPLDEAVRQYLQAKGPLTTADDLQCIGYVTFTNVSVPDIEHVLHVSKPGLPAYEAYRTLYGFTRESFDAVIVPRSNINQISMHSVLLHPRSRGNIRLKSASPFEYPILNPNYFSNPVDAEILVKSVKDQFAIVATEALKKYNTTPIVVSHPDCEKFEYGSDAFWDCMVRTLINTVFHFSGTAQMGPPEEPNAVVDIDLKVRGVDRLRVIDTSVVPVTTSGHTSAVANMVGEKGSDIIKQEYCKKFQDCNYI